MSMWQYVNESQGSKIGTAQEPPATSRPSCKICEGIDLLSVWGFVGELHAPYNYMPMDENIRILRFFPFMTVNFPICMKQPLFWKVPWNYLKLLYRVLKFQVPKRCWCLGLGQNALSCPSDFSNNWLFGDKIRFLGSYDSPMVSIHLRLLYKNDQWNHASGFATNISTSLSLKMQPQRDWLTCGARCVGSEPPKCRRPDANGILRVRIWNYFWIATRHPIGSDLHQASPNWCLSPGVALFWVEKKATKRILKCQLCFCIPIGACCLPCCWGTGGFISGMSGVVADVAAWWLLWERLPSYAHCFSKFEARDLRSASLYHPKFERATFPNFKLLESC